MIVQGIGTGAVLELFTPCDQMQRARLAVEADGESAVINLSSNSLRVLAKLAEAAADELDARAVGT